MASDVNIIIATRAAVYTAINNITQRLFEQPEHDVSFQLILGTITSGHYTGIVSACLPRKLFTVGNASWAGWRSGALFPNSIWAKPVRVIFTLNLNQLLLPDVITQYNCWPRHAGAKARTNIYELATNQKTCARSACISHVRYS